MRHSPTSFHSLHLGSQQTGLGNYHLSPHTGLGGSFDGASDPTRKSNTGAPTHESGAQNLHHGSVDAKPGSNDKEMSLADAGFQAPQNDDSAIDLEDDPMLMTVGKYGDMMASDPADTEGNVIVI